MKKLIKILLLVSILLVCLLAFTLYALNQNWFWQKHGFNLVNDKTDISLNADNFQVNVFKDVTSSGLQLGFNTKDSLVADKFNFNFKPLGLLASRYQLNDIDLKNGTLNLEGVDSLAQIILDINGEFLYKSDPDLYEAAGSTVLHSYLGSAMTVPATHLAGSTLDFDLNQTKETLSIEKFLLKLKDSEEQFADLSISGLHETANSIDLNLNSNNLDLEKIAELFSEQEGQAKQEESDNTAQVEGEPETSKSNSCAAVQSYSTIGINFKLDNLSYSPFAVKDFSGKLEQNGSLLSLSNFQPNINDVPVTISGALDKPSCQIKTSLNVKDFNLAVLLKLADSEIKDVDHGQVDEIDFTATGNLNEDLLNSKGSLKVNATDIWLPSKLQDLIPFNIIFLPFEIILAALEEIGAALLPGELGKQIETLSAALSEAGRLKISEAALDVDFDKKAIQINKLAISPNLLPSIEVTGSISPDKKLDLITNIKLLALNLRVPIAGTTESPRPDLVALVPEIIKGLGLSVLDPLSGSDEASETE